MEGQEEIAYNKSRNTREQKNRNVNTKENVFIQEKTYISNVLEAAADKAKYDTQVKKLLADKNILAWILKYTVREFKTYSIKEIKACIEETPEVATVPLYPGKRKPEAIIGMSTSDSVPNEGEVTYDIRFYAITPEREQIKLLINIEAQKDYYPGYDLVTRGVFYCARMLSAQLDTEFTDSNYEQLKKVYSIWICMDVPDYAAYTLTEYKMEQNNLYGNFPEKARYDLLSVAMVCLGKEENNCDKTELHELLTVLLSNYLTLQEKEELLSENYGIATTREMKEGMRVMCNLSELIEERGIEQGIAQGIEQGIERERTNIILNMLKRGMSTAEICILTESSQEFVEKMREKNMKR